MVEQRVQSKLKSLGVNLAKERLQQWSDKISKRFTEESTDEEINAYVDDFKDLIIEQAKQDDRLRSLENQKPKADTPPTTPTVEQPKDDTPEWAKALLKEVEQLKTEKLQDTLKSQFLSDEKVKGVPKALLETLAPKSAEEYETAIERVNNIALEFNKALPDTTPKTASANHKTATEVDIKNLAKEILN